MSEKDFIEGNLGQFIQNYKLIQVIKNEIIISPWQVQNMSSTSMIKIEERILSQTSMESISYTELGLMIGLKHAFFCY